jgi:hypothetical protein
LFSIGTLEILNANYDKAETVLNELINIVPDDYRTMAKLVQVKYGKKEYDKALAYKTKLYDAYKAGKLKSSLKEMFCFDQFKWKDKRIEAYEKFADANGNGDVKLIFYVLNANDEIEYNIRTEYSLTKKAHELCKDRADYHALYPINFKDFSNYEAIKQGVIDILDGKVQPKEVSGEKKE